MADLLQKVFKILVRPYYVDNSSNKVFYKGGIYGPISNTSTGARYELKTNNTTGDTTSPVRLNEGAKYKSDAWFLHSTYTSYNLFREAMKDIIAVYGTDNVKCGIYVPIDYEILPSK